MLENIMSLLSTGVIFAGGFMIVWGAINLGLTLKDGMQGGGGQLTGAIMWIVGGAIITAAGAYFTTLNM